MASFDSRLRADKVMRRDCDGLWGVGLEDCLDLRRDVITAQRRVLHAPFQNHAIVDRGNRDIGSSNVNNKGGCLAGSETAHGIGSVNGRHIIVGL